MRDRVAVNRLVFPAVHAKVRLPVVIQIQRVQSDSPFNRFLVDPGRNHPPAPHHLSRQSYVHRHYSSIGKSRLGGDHSSFFRVILRVGALAPRYGYT